MDALDEELAKLKLINIRSLSPKEPGSGQNTLTAKKVGPAVPPKPPKKSVPQVPHSSAVKQTCEPLYSTRLQANDEVTKSSGKLSSASKKDIPCHSLNTSNMVMTLDNSTILDQQLEALEYHKKQLEKEGIRLAQNATSTNPSDTTPMYANIPKSMNQSSGSGANRVYANLPVAPPSNSDTNNDSVSAGVVYSNIMHQNIQSDQQPSDIVYSNLGFTNVADELPPPPPLDIPNLNMHESHFDYLNQVSEDELPPPPSPVSSSYSELRRATDNFPQLQSYPLTATYKQSGSNHINNVQSSVNHQNSVGQPTYVNTSFQNDYSTYEPSSQSISQHSSDYYGCGSFSQGSSTYESIYEPINPRPQSQLSSRSNYSLYTSYVNGPQTNNSTTPVRSVIPPHRAATQSNTSGKLSSCKEAEVEVLTDLLVQSMDDEQDTDHFGICVKCGEHVVGENSGCTAMEQIYHIKCFTCSQCQINLQGKPFYALEGKPYCEEDYLNTLEKCSVCMEPILERILRATGKPYHPGCFCCVVCGKSLDGIPFTVDATNQNYCIEDFHKKFAPRCCVCREPIMPEPGQEETVRIVALDRSFHFSCYKCEDCGLLLSSEADGRGCYPLDDHVLCKSCNAARVQALTNRMTTEL